MLSISIGHFDFVFSLTQDYAQYHPSTKKNKLRISFLEILSLDFDRAQSRSRKMAGERGFEPLKAEPESAVIPLHHSPKIKIIEYKTILAIVN